MEKRFPFFEWTSEEEASSIHCQDTGVVAFRDNACQTIELHFEAFFLVSKQHEARLGGVLAVFSDTIEGLGEPLRRDRLEQAIDRVLIESTNGIFRVGANKNHTRPGRKMRQEVETALGRHRNVQENQIRFFAIEQRNDRRNVCRLTDEIHSGLTCQKISHSLAGEGFVIHDKDTKIFHTFEDRRYFSGKITCRLTRSGGDFSVTVAKGPQSISRRWRRLDSPMPVDEGSLSLTQCPVFSTITFRSPPRKCA